MPFTYAAFSKERELAPGQISYGEMKHLYRYDSINRDTQVFGVVGDPIAQSSARWCTTPRIARKR